MPFGYRVQVLGDAGNAVATFGLTLSGTQYSSAWTAGNAPNFSIHLEFTGTPTTAVTLWKSNKPNPNVANDNDWVQDTDVTFTGAAGAAAKEFKEVGNSGGAQYRLKLVTSGGSGKASCWINGKPAK